MQELTKLLNQEMTPVVHYTLLSSEHSDGMDDDPGAAPYEPTGDPYPYPRVHISAAEVSRARMRRRVLTHRILTIFIHIVYFVHILHFLHL